GLTDTFGYAPHTACPSLQPCPEPKLEPLRCELVRQDLGKPRLRPLAHLGLVERERDDPVGADAQPGIEGERGVPGGGRRIRAPWQGEGDHQACGGADEVSAGDGAHATLPLMTTA